MHEPCRYVYNINDWLVDNKRWAYDLDNPGKHPKKVLAQTELELDVIGRKHPNIVTSGWCNMFTMYLYHQKHSDVPWLITLRKPLECCCSLYKHISEYVDFVKITEKYDWYMTFFLHQAERMNPKPRWMLYSKLVKGEYNRKLMDLGGIRASEQQAAKAAEHWHNPVNCGGPAKRMESSLLKYCNEKYNKVMEICEEL